jgi:hypothetical protein
VTFFVSHYSYDDKHQSCNDLMIMTTIMIISVLIVIVSILLLDI